ncbi:hypothetical protein PILCRDRAFT_824376 [Piloderma croceum F 1598]|uniref:Uncharacterized protein n=1 Tax=Piloderma croceum (strain F 1598) TaxID=765440 RepID=A0A0C3FEQ2_PILCF|nr:hypothetical protein PILCRDRAFT_824376 [Piloderma croceum F 1598]
MSYENQGIVDGRQAGMLGPSKNPLDTVVDHDASATSPVGTSAESTLTGATSGDVHQGIGMPASGMSSQERHHDGQVGRKKQREGLDQFGQEKVFGNG